MQIRFTPEVRFLTEEGRKKAEAAGAYIYYFDNDPHSFAVTSLVSVPGSDGHRKYEYVTKQDIKETGISLDEYNYLMLEKAGLTHGEFRVQTVAGLVRTERHNEIVCTPEYLYKKREAMESILCSCNLLVFPENSTCVRVVAEENVRQEQISAYLDRINPNTLLSGYVYQLHVGRLTPFIKFHHNEKESSEQAKSGQQSATEQHLAQQLAKYEALGASPETLKEMMEQFVVMQEKLKQIEAVTNSYFGNSASEEMETPDVDEMER